MQWWAPIRTVQFATWLSKCALVANRSGFANRRTLHNRSLQAGATGQWEGLPALRLGDGLNTVVVERSEMPETPAARSALQQLQKDLGLSPSSLESQSDPIFVCIDCEAYERSHHKVTEIGVAILDTKDLKDIHAGDEAENWIRHMNHAHYRLAEHGKLVNRKFLTGREQYFNFGNTTWITIADAKQTLQRIFGDPTRIADAAHFHVSITDQKRDVVLVGHGLHNDRAFLSKVGFPVADVTNIVRNVDTEVVGGGTKKKGISLRRLLMSLKIDATNLHNAGNDAAYTLQALISAAWKDYRNPGSIFRDLDNITGKLPPMSYTNNTAPMIWAGTTRAKGFATVSPVNNRRNYATASEQRPQAGAIHWHAINSTYADDPVSKDAKNNI